jgi:hypothetical protein
MNYDESKLIFFTGAPGSKWSSISHLITKNTKYPINHSDYNSSRFHLHKNGIAHQGAYWGPGNGLGENFHRLYRMSKDEIVNEIDKAYEDKTWEKYRIIKCHQFSLNLDYIKETFPKSKILMIMRNNRSCYTSWMSSGGFDLIKFPNYDLYYKNPDELMKHICKENEEINNFVVKHDLDIYVVYKKYFKDFWGLDTSEEENNLYTQSLERTINEKKTRFIYNIDISIAHYNF